MAELVIGALALCAIGSFVGGKKNTVEKHPTRHHPYSTYSAQNRRHVSWSAVKPRPSTMGPPAVEMAASPPSKPTSPIPTDPLDSLRNESQPETTNPPINNTDSTTLEVLAADVVSTHVEPPNNVADTIRETPQAVVEYDIAERSGARRQRRPRPSSSTEDYKGVSTDSWLSTR